MLLLYVALRIQSKRLSQHRVTGEMKQAVPVVGWLTIIFLPIIAFAVYFNLGAGSQLQTWFQVRDETQFFVQLSTRIENGQLDEKGAIQSVLRYLAQHPESGQGWGLLGRLYLDSGQYVLAEQTYTKADALLPDDITIQSSLAYAAYLTEGAVITARVASLIKAVLAQDPQNPSIHNLLAGNAFRNADYETAFRQWGAILDSYPKDSSSYTMIVSAMQRARERLSELAGEPTDVEGLADLDVTVNINQTTDLDLAAAKYTFVYVRLPDNPMPIWALRSETTQFPANFSLDIANALIADQTLPVGEPLIVGVRITTQTGIEVDANDIQQEVIFTPTSTLATNVQITLN